MFRPELLSPAGTLKNMRYAFAYGADAVYAGQPRYSLRVRNNEFDHDNLQLGINEAHALGKKLYVVFNIQPLLLFFPQANPPTQYRSNLQNLPPNAQALESYRQSVESLG